MMYTKDFNSLPHAEVDSLFSSISLLLPYFNSLPHAEVDGTAAIEITAGSSISTHYLTQR